LKEDKNHTLAAFAHVDMQDHPIVDEKQVNSVGEALTCKTSSTPKSPEKSIFVFVENPKSPGEAEALSGSKVGLWKPNVSRCACPSTDLGKV
jgi:hypothetical protein